jgi:hypothetical protein
MTRSVAALTESDRMSYTNAQEHLKLSHTSNNSKLTKQTIKYLACCSDIHAYIAVTRAAPVSVIHRICNAALNVDQDDTHLSSKQSALFSEYRNDIAALASLDVSTRRKRKVIQSQNGGFLFITH